MVCFSYIIVNTLHEGVNKDVMMTMVVVVVVMMMIIITIIIIIHGIFAIGSNRN
jgi:hypothetical protein